MSNIWSLSTGESATENKDTSFDSNNFDPLPHNSFHNAVVADIKWDEYDDEEYINVTWQIADESEYKNRKVFHKIKVQAEKATTRDNAIKMLVTLNNIAEADLLSIAAPTDEDLQRELMGAVAMIKVQVWKIDDKSGNWVSALGEAGELPEGSEGEKSSSKGGTANNKQGGKKKKFF